MKAGRLDRRVELRHRVLTYDTTTGQNVESWPAAYATVWASKRDIRGREFFAAQTVNAEIATIFQIRHRTDVLMTDRLVLDGLSYNISAIQEMGRRDGLELQSAAVKP